MSLADIAILAVVAVALFFAVRSFTRSEKDGCSDCGSASSCSVRATGGSCKVADEMLRHADAALGPKRR